MVLNSLRLAFNALFSFRFWLLLLIPPLVAGLLISVLFFIFWSPLNSGMANLLSSFRVIEAASAFLGSGDVLVVILSGVFLFLLFLPILLAGVLVTTSMFVTPLVQREVALKYFPHLAQKHGGSNVGSAWNSVKALLVFVMLFVMTLPLWLVPGLQILIPAFLVVALNKKIFLYDVLQDFASKEERLAIQGRYAGGLWALGAVLVIASYLPLAFVFLPVFSAFAYSFFALNALQALRAQGPP